MPQQQAGLDNPFDDRNQANEATRIDTSAQPKTQPGQQPSTHHDDEEESPQVARTYRF